MMSKSFGSAVKKLRELKGWKRKQLASRSGLQDSTLSMIERGKRTDPRCSTLTKLADALDVSADVILIEAGMKSPRHTRNSTDLSIKETEIIRSVRAIQSHRLRQHTIEAMLEFARGAQKADMDLR